MRVCYLRDYSPAQELMRPKGKLADIVLLDANPLEDIKNTQSIWRVIKGGWVFDPEALRPERN